MAAVALWAVLGLAAGAAEPVVLNVYMGWDSSHQVNQVINAYIAEYEALHPHVKINNLGRQESADVLLTHIIGGVAPDIVKGGMTMLLTLHMAEALTPVPEHIAQRIKAEFFPVAADAVTIDGRLIAVPMEGNSTALMVNQRILSEKGIGRIPDTWNEFAQLARRLTVYDSQGKIVTPALVEAGQEWSLCYFVLGMFKAEGAGLLDDQGNLTLNTPEARAAVQNLTTALTGNPYMQLGWGPQGRFKNGEIPFGLAFPWWLNGVNDISDFRTTLIPAGSQGYGSAFYNHGYAVTKDSKHQEEAWRFLEWLAFNKRGNEGTPLGHMAAKVGVLPITRWDASSVHFASILSAYGGFMDSLNHGVHPSTILSWGLNNWTVIARLVTDVANRGIAPDTAFENVTTILKTRLEEIRALRNK